MGGCVFCGNEFKVRTKGFRRSSCKLKIKEMTIVSILADFDVKATPKEFVCNKCFKLLKDFIRLDEAIMSRTGMTLRKKPKKLIIPATPNPEPVTKTFKSKVLNAVAKSHYTTAIQHIGRCKAGKSALQKYCMMQVRKEATNYSTMENEMSKNVTQETLHDFSWKNIIEDVKKNLPFLYASLSGAITNRNNEDELLKVTEESFGAAVPVIGMAASMLMYRRKARKMDYLQKLCSLAMWGSGSGKKLFQHFHRLGVSKGSCGVTGCIDRLVKDCDKEMNAWKRELEPLLNLDTSHENYRAGKKSEDVTEQMVQPVLNLDSSEQVYTAGKKLDDLIEQMVQPVLNLDSSQQVYTEDKRSDDVTEQMAQPVLNLDSSQQVYTAVKKSDDVIEQMVQPVLNLDSSQQVYRADKRSDDVTEQMVQPVLNLDSSQQVYTEDKRSGDVTEQMVQPVLNLDSPQQVYMVVKKSEDAIEQMPEGIGLTSPIEAAVFSPPIDRPYHPPMECMDTDVQYSIQMDMVSMQVDHNYSAQYPKT